MANQAPALHLDDLPTHTTSNYPSPFRERVLGTDANGRRRKRLGDAFGLKNFGVNVTTLAPGASSALRHYHMLQDELILVLEGELVLCTDAGETLLTPGMFAGFAAGVPNGHHLVNRSTEDARYIEVGDRTPGDQATYPDDDISARDVDGKFVFSHKDGRPY